MDTKTFQSIKVRALRMIEQLPNDCSWDDLLYQIHVGKTLDEGLKELREGKFIEHSDICKKYGIPE